MWKEISSGRYEEEMAVETQLLDERYPCFFERRIFNAKSLKKVAETCHSCKWCLPEKFAKLNM